MVAWRVLSVSTMPRYALTYTCVETGLKMRKWCIYLALDVAPTNHFGCISVSSCFSGIMRVSHLVIFLGWYVQAVAPVFRLHSVFH